MQSALVSAPVGISVATVSITSSRPPTLPRRVAAWSSKARHASSAGCPAFGGGQGKQLPVDLVLADEVHRLVLKLTGQLSWSTASQHYPRQVTVHGSKGDNITD